MALDSRTKVRLGWVAAAAAPMLAVQAAQLFFGAGPATAGAQPALPENPPVAAIVPGVVPALVVGPEQTTALAWLSGRAKNPSTLPSPMHRPAAPVTPVMPVHEDVAAVPQQQPLPNLRLGGVISRRGGEAVASINNRLFIKGDQPADGWTIQTIDYEGRRVALVRVDGRRIELTPDGVADPVARK